MLLCKLFIRRLSSKANRTFTSKVFGKYLFVTNTLTCSALMGLGDAMQQTIEKSQKKKRHYDWQRMAHMAAVGLVMGPVVHFWYTRLDKFFPGTRVKTIVKKVIADQIIASPVFLIIFFTGLGTLEGKSIKDSLVEFKTKFPMVYLAEWLCWPPAQAINFYFLPSQFRVVYVNVLILLWDCFLSYMKHRDQKIPALVNVHASKSDALLPASPSK